MLMSECQWGCKEETLLAAMLKSDDFNDTDVVLVIGARGRNEMARDRIHRRMVKDQRRRHRHGQRRTKLTAKLRRSQRVHASLVQRRVGRGHLADKRPRDAAQHAGHARAAPSGPCSRRRSPDCACDARGAAIGHRRQQPQDQRSGLSRQVQPRHGRCRHRGLHA